MKFEYLVIDLPEDRRIHQDRLNELAEKGWELVVVAGYRLYLKRPIPA